MSRSLVFEIGVEELPATFIDTPLTAMPGLIGGLLSRARLDHGAIRALGTPRRLAVQVQRLADRQRDLEEVVHGPPESAAFEADGTPKKAAVGFAKKNGVELSELRVEETEKGRYVAVTRKEAGRPTSEVLPSLLAELASSLPFPKSMRWGHSKIAFGRPIHWLLALHGEELVPVEFTGVQAGRSSRGHRFLAPGEVTIPSADGYLDALRQAHVWADREELSARMVEALDAAAAAGGGALVPDAFLVTENAAMVEEAHALLGTFDPAFLALPEEVIIAVMRGHQRYFAVSKEGGGLMPNYLAVLNTAEDRETIRRGNDRVLRARLSDARFFVEEDKKKGMDARAAQLASVVFQAKLGTMAERVARIGEVVTSLSGGRPEAAEAARLCKADLVSLIVGEFPELQGLMGRWYALGEGRSEEVADAIRDHYLPKGKSDDLPPSALSAQLAVSERADTLVGCFGIGLVPSGSADPFALRRAALGIVRIAAEGPIDVDLRALLSLAYAAYARQEKPLADEEAVKAELEAFFRARLRVFCVDGALGAPVRGDVVDAALAAWQGGSLRDLFARVRSLASFLESAEFEALAVAFKRAFNIAKDAPDGEADPALFEEGAERRLAESFAEVRAQIEAKVEGRAYEEALALAGATLKAPIDRFFDEVFVMVEDAAVRDNRLRLLAGIARSLTGIAHFHLLSS